MKVSKMRTYWIVFRSIVATLITSLKVLWFYFTKRLTREKVDELGREWSKKIVSYVDLHYEVFNPYHVSFEPNHTYIVMSNHASHYDIPLILLSLPGSIRMIAKKELFKVPIWGKAMQVSEFISIDRENRRQAIKDLEFAREKMESGIIPWIAPEGTRSRTGLMNPFKKGGFFLAMKTKATIIPVAIKGSAKILPAKTLDFSVGEKVEIHICKPIDPSHYDNNEKDQLVKDVEDSIRNFVM